MMRKEKNNSMKAYETEDSEEEKSKGCFMLHWKPFRTLRDSAKFSLRYSPAFLRPFNQLPQMNTSK